MTNDTTTISPALFGASSAVVGLGAGYVFAPRKYSLKRLLSKDNDTFEKTFSSDVMKNSSETEKSALKRLKEAAEEYRKSGSEIQKNEIKPNVIEWKKMKDAVPVPNELKEDLNTKKAACKKAVADNDFINIRKTLNQLQEKALANPNDTKINQDLKDASKKFTEAQKALEIPINEYKNSWTAYKNAKENAIKELPDKGKTIIDQYEKVLTAIKKRTNEMYIKLAEISKRDGLKNDYKAVKKYIPKARTYSAIMGGIITGIAGVLAGVFISNLQKN